MFVVALVAVMLCQAPGAATREKLTPIVVEKLSVDPERDSPIFRRSLAAILSERLEKTNAGLYRMYAGGAPESREFRIESPLFRDETIKNMAEILADKTLVKTLAEVGFRSLVFVGPEKEWQMEIKTK